jgi:hypothetical protein
VASPIDSFDPRPILRGLVAHDVEFVVIGGIAGILRGSAYNTHDLDIVCEQSGENRRRLARALQAVGARRRGASRVTFDTPYGSLDVFDRLDGAPRYAELRRAAGEPFELDVGEVRVASLDHLIAIKEARGRLHDKLMGSEYREISDLIRTKKIRRAGCAFVHPTD